MKVFNLKSSILHEIHLHVLFDSLTLVKLFAQFENNDKFPKTCQNNILYCYMKSNSKHAGKMNSGINILNGLQR